MTRPDSSSIFNRPSLTAGRENARSSPESAHILSAMRLSTASMFSTGAIAMTRWISSSERRTLWRRLMSMSLRRNVMKAWISSARFSKLRRHSLSVTAASRPKNSYRWTWWSYFEPISFHLHIISIINAYLRNYFLYGT